MSVIRTVTQCQPQTAGMALGGIGCGSVEIHSDGRLDDFDIFNLGRWATAQPSKYGMDDLPGYRGDILPFYLRVKEPDTPPVVRRLSHNSRSGGFRSMMYSWMKGVEEISWTPEFPVCRMEYRDKALPVKVRAEFTSPFIPHDARISGTPGFYVTFHLSNPTEHSVEVSLLGALKNPVNRGIADRQLKNTVTRDAGRTTLTMASTSPEPHRQNGSISLSVSGGESTFIQGDFEPFFGAYVQGGPFGITEESCLFDFRETGELPDSGWETPDEALLALTESEIGALDGEELKSATAQLLRLPSAARPFRRIGEVSPALLESPEERRRFLCMVLDCYRELPQEFADSQWGGGALCSKLTLGPGESRSVRFTAAWFFPNHFSSRGHFVGHQYAGRFRNSSEVSTFLCENAEHILEKAGDFSRLLLSTDVPAPFVRSWSAQLNTLIKCSWWSRNGEFGIWEGYGSCGFHTTDISYYGSFGLLALFPELELRQMKMTAEFQREDGRIPHFFTPDFDSVDGGFDRVDMNPQFVLLVCRDYLWTGDREYLSRMWGAVVRAMESTEQLDSDGDGLPDRDTGANTYDAWKFRGTPAYIAGLWLAALTAGVRMAADSGDRDCELHWGELLKKGRKSFVEKLWNGRYFSLWVDGEDRDECCMSGQLDGIWYARLLGLPPILDAELIRPAIQSVLRNNFHPETGLINAGYPPDSRLTLYTYHNVQADANWSGVEFGFSSFLLELGYLTEAEELVRAVEERYYSAGRILNHEECGEYYYRALSSWTLLLSLSGFKPDVPGKILTISPVLETMTIPWFAPSGSGILTRTACRLEISCTEGELPFGELRVPCMEMADPIPGDSGVCVNLDGKPLAAEGICCKENTVWIRFPADFRLSQNSILTLECRGQ